MAFKTFVAATSLPAADLNTYLMKQSVIVCTSGTRPSSPTEGMTIYETDTDKLLIYTTATTLWQPPWNMAWGAVATVESSAVEQGSITSVADVTGVTVTFTAVANRRYRIMADGIWFQTTTPGVGSFTITNGAGTLLTLGGRSDEFIGAAATQSSFHVKAYTTLTSGSQTVKLRAAALSGTAMTIFNSTAKSTLVVEDAGPTAAPA